MIDLALDASEPRATRPPEVQPGQSAKLRVVLLGLAGAVVLGGFGVAAATMMSGLAAPAPAKFVSSLSGRAADWPDLKDGLPALAGPGLTAHLPAKAEAPDEPPASPQRMASLPDTFSPPTTPLTAAAPATTAASAQAAAVSPARRIPTPTPVVPVAAARQVVPLPPARMAALQPPRASETVRAREIAEPSAPPKPVATPKPIAATPAPAQSEKPNRKAVAAQKQPIAAKAAEKSRSGATTAVAQAEAAPEETEVLGIKLPSLAPAGRKIRESVDALGEAVKSVF